MLTDDQIKKTVIDEIDRACIRVGSRLYAAGQVNSYDLARAEKCFQAAVLAVKHLDLPKK